MHILYTPYVRVHAPCTRSNNDPKQRSSSTSTDIRFVPSQFIGFSRQALKSAAAAAAFLSLSFSQNQLSTACLSCMQQPTIQKPFSAHLACSLAIAGLLTCHLAIAIARCIYYRLKPRIYLYVSDWLLTTLNLAMPAKLCSTVVAAVVVVAAVISSL